MTDTKKRADEIVRSVLTPADWSPHAMFLIDGQWCESKWGCDTMDHLRDEIQAELERKHRWTPIEEAGDWDGEMMVHYECVVKDSHGKQKPAGGMIRLCSLRDYRPAMNAMITPSRFNPEDYKEVKP